MLLYLFVAVFYIIFFVPGSESSPYLLHNAFVRVHMVASSFYRINIIYRRVLFSMFSLKAKWNEMGSLIFGPKQIRFIHKRKSKRKEKRGREGCKGEIGIQFMRFVKFLCICEYSNLTFYSVTFFHQIVVDISSVGGYFLCGTLLLHVFQQKPRNYASYKQLHQQQQEWWKNTIKIV